MSDIQEQIPEEVGQYDPSVKLGWAERSAAVCQQAYQIGKTALQTAVTLVEVAPGLNEGVRGAIWGSGEFVTQNPIGGAISFGLATLGVEAIGAVAAAPLLGSERSGRAIGMVNDKIAEYKRGWDNFHFSRRTKVTATLFGGSVVGMALEQLEDPTRTVAQSRRSGLWKSAWLTGPCAVQGALMTEGINIGFDYPGPTEAVIAGVGTLVGTKVLAGRISRNRRNDTYQNVIANPASGPQLEGLPDAEIKRALRDKHSEYLSFYDGTTGEIVKVPFLVPIRHAAWINKDFLAKHGYPEENLFYCALPQDFLTRVGEPLVSNALQEIVEKRGTTNIVFDSLEGRALFEHMADRDAVIDNLMTEAETPAGIFHFRTRLTADETALESYVSNPAVRSLEKEDIKRVFPRIWEIYSERFKDLVDDHPINGALPKRILKKALLSDGCVTKGFFDEEGTLQAFGYIVEDLKLCEWLNVDYLKDQASSDVKVVYFPGIAKSADYSAPISGLIMQSFAADMGRKYGTFDLTFECSNKSVQEIPRLVKIALKRSGFVGTSDYQEETYRYQVMKLHPSS